ncbi:MAG: 30S ribosome-binding factor RbfA [Gemmatimonadota bacterium]|jgi:ribosome-binding factor A|nr:30S ribosome-binding factor RbfA [Gemmatimonadota bacterium]
MARYRRTARINEQLREEISLLIRSDVNDPRVSVATITGVETSPELDHAKVWITALGDEDGKTEALAGLRSAAAFIRAQLGRRLHIRRIPELHFEIDRRLENAMHIASLLREVLPADLPVDSDGVSAEDAPEGADSSVEEVRDGE